MRIVEGLRRDIAVDVGLLRGEMEHSRNDISSFAEMVVRERATVIWSPVFKDSGVRHVTDERVLVRQRQGVPTHRTPMSWGVRVVLSLWGCLVAR